MLELSAPWSAHVAPFRDALAASDWRAALTQLAHARGVTSAGGAPLAFVAGDDAPAGVAYETHVATTGRVPTRANGHDRCNALTWLALPRTKRALNARQASEIARLGIGGARGAVRDAITLLDESGVLLACDDAALFDLLAARRWHELLVGQRARWHREIVPVVIGHAALGKLAAPYKALTAMALRVPRGDGSVEAIDAAAADFIGSARLAPGLLAPLPLLGVPGWWAANEAAQFYEDSQVFRPLRQAA